MRLPKDLEAKVLAQATPAKRTAPARSLATVGGTLVFPAVSLTVPVKLVSEMNRRDHWAARKRRFDAQAGAVWSALVHSAMAEPLLSWIERNTGPVRVCITRVGRQRMDGDNLQGAGKAVRDTIARFLLLDDGSPRWVWEYRQEVAKVYSVKIRITTEPPEATA